MRQTKDTSAPGFELPLHLTRLEHLEHVAFLHVLVAVEHDAALEAGGHLAGVLLRSAAASRSGRSR